MAKFITEGRMTIILYFVLVCGPSFVLMQTLDPYDQGLNSRVDQVSNHCGQIQAGLCDNEYNAILAAATKASRCPALTELVKCSKASCSPGTFELNTYKEIDNYCSGAMTNKVSVTIMMLLTIFIVSFLITEL